MCLVYYNIQSLWILVMMVLNVQYDICMSCTQVLGPEKKLRIISWNKKSLYLNQNQRENIQFENSFKNHSQII